ncbi:MAG: ATP-binding cassette domain-containing protein [Burkholderiaceae bacterium]|nr:ATP-binding cassette domain-containing protein [Burkholderiaceae bacterium]
MIDGRRCAIPADTVLQVRGLRFAYPDQPALFDGWSADIGAGLTRLQGEAGKSTLLRLLAGALAGDGRVVLAGRRLDTDRAAWRREACWIDPRDPAWDPLRPDELMAEQQALHPGFDATAWQRHLAGFDLASHRGKSMLQLSTGTRRKVALAAALSAGCALTLLDEPTAGLDRPAIGWLEQALTEAAGEPGRAWLLASAWGLEDALPWAGTITL